MYQEPVDTEQNPDLVPEEGIRDDPPPHVRSEIASPEAEIENLGPCLADGSPVEAPRK